MPVKCTRTAAVIALVLYLLLLTWGILYKFGSPVFELSHPYRMPINLVPFGAVLQNERLAANEMLFNVAAFVPLGLLLSVLKRPKRVVFRILAGLIISLLFEALQYLLAIGSADITDVILNTLGAALGVGVYYLARLIFKQKTDSVVTILTLAAVILAAAFVVFLSVAS